MEKEGRGGKERGGSKREGRIEGVGVEMERGGREMG